MMRPKSPVERVLVLGLDGGTFDVFRPLIEAGKMPHLATLLRRSARASLASTDPYITPTAWSTFLTGVDPWRHGILDYRYFDSRDRQIRLHNASDLRVPTLFDAVADSCGDVVSLNLPMTYSAPSPHVDELPPAQGGKRLVIGGLDAPSTEATLAPYPEFARRLDVERISLDLDPIWRRRPRDYDELDAGVARTEQSFLARAAAARVADRMTDWRLMVVQFQTLDTFQHFCWSFLDLEGNTAAEEQQTRRGLSGPGRNAWSKWIDRARHTYTALDNAIGELLDLAGKRGAAVVALSDHGFGPFRQQISLPEVLRQRGLLAPAPMSSQVRHSAACMARNLQKWMHRRAKGGSTASLPMSLHSILPCDWKKSTAVALHCNLGGLIYLNTPARFGSGPVATETARQQALADTTAALAEARHPETNELLFEKVLRTADHVQEDLCDRMLPELVAIPSPGFHTRTRLDKPGELMRDSTELSGTHRREGLLAVDALRVIPGRYVTNLRDVAPTILSMLGLPFATRLDGKVMDGMFHPLAEDRVEDEQVEAVVDLSREFGPMYQDEGTAEIESRLRALGYMD